MASSGKNRNYEKSNRINPGNLFMFVPRDTTRTGNFRFSKLLCSKNLRREPTKARCFTLGLITASTGFVLEVQAIWVSFYFCKSPFCLVTYGLPLLQ